jgi:hypothetical protein
VPSLGLSVVRILDFQPAADRGVRPCFSLRDNTFQITGANFLEQIHAPAFDVHSADDILDFALLDQCAQFCFALKERNLSEIAPVQVKDVEGVKGRRTLAVEKFVENAPASESRQTNSPSITASFTLSLGRLSRRF